MVFSTQEKAFCVVEFGKLGSCVAVQRSFKRQYLLPVRAKVPHKDSIKQWFDKFLAFGDVKRKKRSNTRWVRTNLAIATVLSFFTADRHSSIRSVARKEGTPSRRTIQRILKDEKFKPYKLSLIHALRPRDHQVRVLFAQSQLVLINASPAFLNNLVFCDEAHFQLNGGVNRHNFRYWDDDNPHWFEQVPLHSPRVTVFALIGRQGIVGPCFFQENINSANYLNLLQQQVVPELQEWPNFNELIFMQDGAPPHWALRVRAYLSEVFPERWMGRGSQNLPLPPYSPDLTPCDFFLWSWIKSRVYREPIADVDELIGRIELAFEELPQEMVNNCIAAYPLRLNRCIAVGGRSVEETFANV